MSAPVRAARPDRTRDDYRYHLLRAASARFKCGVGALTPPQQEAAAALAARTLALEDLVLGTSEAAAVVIPDTDRQRAFSEVKGRYASEAEFEDDLARNGLDSDALRRALRRELTFDAVMRRIGNRHPPVSETDERLFYELHQDRFQRPERRTARHILITVNDDYPENRRAAALARLEAIAAQLAPPAGGPASAANSAPGSAAPADTDPDTEHPAAPGIESLGERFARLAQRHSECPTALDGGHLGTLARGQLFPAVDAALFGLDAGAVSAIVESPVGLHLVLCEAIVPAAALPFDEVRPRLRDALLQRRRREAQRAWLAQLGAPALEQAATT